MFSFRHCRAAVAAIAAVSAVGTMAQAQNLVNDPSFEISGAAGAFISGWSVTATNPFGSGPGLRNMSYGWPTHTGTWAVDFGSPGIPNGGVEDTLSQNIPTIAGTTYTVSFWLDNYVDKVGSTPDGQGFTANFANGSLAFNTILTAYTLYTFTGTATASTTTLNLAGFDYLNSGYYMLDDVSVVPQAAGPTRASWINAGSGDWNAVANWSPSIPNGIGAEADFLASITSASTVTTSLAQTLGTIKFNNANAYTLAGSGSLTMQTSTGVGTGVGTGSALIDVQAGTHTIQLPLTLASNTTFQTDSATAGLVISGPLTLNAGVTLSTTGSGTVIYMSSITLNSAASITFANSSSATTLTLGTSAIATLSQTTVTRAYLQLTGLSLATGATLDLTDNDLVIHGGNLSTITSEIKTGFLGGSSPWTGLGITSSTAAGDSRHLTALGVIEPTSAAIIIDGNSVATTDVFVKFTYFGDANLDGKVDGSDYSRIDSAYASHGPLTGWSNGDFNYDGVVDGSDYTLIDNAFNNQSAQLDSQIAGAEIAAQISATATVPEPTAFALAGITAAAMLSRRRRKSLSQLLL